MIEPVSFAWTVGTFIVTVIASAVAAHKVTQWRLKQIETDIAEMKTRYHELEKEILNRLRSIELALAKLTALQEAHRPQHWSERKEE